MSVCFLVQKIGPYHHARLAAAACRGSITAVEFRPDDSVYAWDKVQARAGYGRRIAKAGNVESVLAEVNPAVIVCTGYADAEIHQALRWGLHRGVPLVVCSDSTFDDELRTGWREALKRRLLAVFQAGLAAGLRSSHYLQHLGLPEQRIFKHWDVVDNAYFAGHADAVRREMAQWRAKLGLPENFFLCVARFVSKKNHGGLLNDYAGYVARAGERAWSLVLSGSGPLEESLKRQVEEARLSRLVHFAGFQQYETLPVYHGLAGALVLPSLSDQWGLVVNEAMAAGLPVLVSERCGCAPDLVEHGANGFVFDPAQPGELAQRMGELAAMPAEQRAAMGRRSRENIARFSPESFAEGFWAAVECARKRGPARAGFATRALLAVLSRRRVA
jgi:glycosyltransferase involved in cell wall biosynthesis